MLILSTTTPPENERLANIRRFEAGVHLLAELVIRVVVDADASCNPIVAQNAASMEKSAWKTPELP